MKYEIYPPSKTKIADIERALFLFEDYFIPKLSERVDLVDYAIKLSTKSFSIIAKDGNEIVGFSSFYCNSYSLSYWTLLAVHKQYRGNRIAHSIIDQIINCCKEKSSTGLEMEMHASNLKLLDLYFSYDFVIKNSFVSSENHYKFQLQLNFNKTAIKHFPFVETTVSCLDAISQVYNNEIYVKRDDCFEIAQGGNKARKLQYILYKAKSEGYNAVVTAGDINSNHNRATAIMCAKLGLKAKLIVHNDYPENESKSMNMNMIRLTGAETIYCSKIDVKETMDSAMQDFTNQGLLPYYIYGGGHCLEGSYAYYEAVVNLKKQIDFQPDYIFFASGTGTTHAGLHVGMKDFFPKAKVIGISIARNRERGIDKVYESVAELENYLGKTLVSPKEAIYFDDSFMGGGYESAVDEVRKIIRQVVMFEGLLLDPTYSGKAFWGMIELISELNLKGKKILFWNTGGIYNLLSSLL